eukprot:TRINITY_DN8410_c5_g1_i1.p1 TRINITY_DN8410_c5_g1~~TRINITY_DN8410_c5_g1_i1.p1  ORF type:complete len:260 (+),score=44.84 TRINITY_DN8410_c5_g1_i1:137-916(+)
MNFNLSRISLCVVIAAAAVILQGCSIPTHTKGYWEVEKNYFEKYQYEIPGKPETARLNSCQDSKIPHYLQCNGHGHCATWEGSVVPDQKETIAGKKNSAVANPLLKSGIVKFCKCDEAWADPNCSTPRQSQVTAFSLSIFGGFLGLDLFYLGHYSLGLVKLFTLGGLGFWWIFDVVRIGSSPVYSAESFKVAANLPHWVFVISVIAFFSAVAFALSFHSIERHRIRKAKEVMLLMAEGPAQLGGTMKSHQFAGYGSTVG